VGRISFVDTREHLITDAQIDMALKIIRTDKGSFADRMADDLKWAIEFRDENTD
jgi:hypothetical protein